MSWFLKATRTRIVVLTMTLFGLVAGLLRGETAPVPSLTEGALAPVPVVAALCLAAGAAVFWGWSGMAWSATAAAVRAPAALLLVPYLVAPLVLAAASFVFGGTGAIAENLRDAFGLAGLTVIGARIFGAPGSVALPVTYLLAAFMLGRPSGGANPYLWAWVIHDGGNVAAFGIAAAIATLGGALIAGLPGRLVSAESE